MTLLSGRMVYGAILLLIILLGVVVYLFVDKRQSTEITQNTYEVKLDQREVESKDIKSQQTGSVENDLQDTLIPLDEIVVDTTSLKSWRFDSYPKYTFAFWYDSDIWRIDTASLQGGPSRLVTIDSEFCQELCGMALEVKVIENFKSQSIQEYISWQEKEYSYIYENPNFGVIRHYNGREYQYFEGHVTNYGMGTMYQFVVMSKDKKYLFDLSASGRINIEELRKVYATLMFDY